MSKFEDMLNEYKTVSLGEAVPPAPAPPAPMGAEQGMEAPIEEPQGPSAEDVVDELGKKADKPWVDLAGILSRAMEYDFTDDQIDEINNKLPDDLTLTSFIDSRNSGEIRDKYAPNIEAAAISFFDIVEDVMTDNGTREIRPAEDI